MKTAPELTRDRVRELLDYNPQTGALTWRKARRGRYANIGDEAGSVLPNGHVRVGIDGEIYSAARVIFLYANGFFPTGRMTYADGDPQNLRWTNLADPRRGLSQSRIARARREQRSVNKLAEAHLMTNAAALRQYQSSPENARAVMRQLRAQVRQERRRYLHPDDYV